MKKIILSLLTIGYLGLNAQIFINTNPNARTTTQSTTTSVSTPVTPSSTTVTTPAVKTTTTSTTVTTPTVTTPTVTTPVVTTPSVTTPKVTAPAISTPKVTTTSNYTTTAYTNTNAVSANIDEDVPPNAVPGKCYARCLVEDKYTFVTETVVDQPKVITKVKVPATIKTVLDTVVVQPASTKMITVPAKYETVKEQVMVTPATTKWVKGKADAGCLSANPEDCQVMCLVEVPATYKTVDKQILVNEAYTRQESTPMEYKITSREVVVTPERIVDVETPATYKTVQKRVLQQKGGYEVWREILCGDDLTDAKIIAIQKALKASGYNPGPIDNVFGSQTKAALIQYQKDKNLPIGNLNIETLKALGVY